MHSIFHFISGAAMFGFLAIAFFFYRFWQKTEDRLFAAFSAAFCLLAMERIVLLATTEIQERAPYVYLFRFAAFMLIILAILLKNLPGRGRK
jgi:hypothetical protein